MDTRVSKILRRKGHDVVTAPPTATVRECIATMVQHNVGSIVIIDRSTIEGIFTERDYLRRVALRGRTSRSTRVEEVMSRDVIYAEPNYTVEQCMQIMTAHRCRHLPVLREEQLDGIISIGDCVKQISSDAQAEARQLKAYIRGQYPTP